MVAEQKYKQVDWSKGIPYDILVCGAHEYPQEHEKRLQNYFNKKSLETIN